jgi:EAL domain-containing protein (putative c-di-GMP-specific phosphodiesterase class I)
MSEIPLPQDPPPLDALRFLYQPVECLSGRDDAWHEALVRWFLPDGTVQGPDKVLPYWLEPTRQPTFTRFTVQHAAEALRAHPGARLSINLSPRQASHPTALCALEDVLPEVRGRLIVELTEQRYLDIGGLWASLAALGDKLALVLLDDVSVADLERRWQLDAPVDGIKLDRSVLALLRDRDPRPGVAKLVRDASVRFPVVVAEGVEAELDARPPRRHRRDPRQGFGIGRPGRALAPDDLRARARGRATERPEAERMPNPGGQHATCAAIAIAERSRRALRARPSPRDRVHPEGSRRRTTHRAPRAIVNAPGGRPARAPARGPAARPEPMLYYGDRPLAVDRAKGDWLWDVEGNRYLDFFGGILTVSVGHANDEVVEATAAQMRTVGHTSTLYLNEITVKVAEKLARDHARPAQGVVLHQQRHRGRRDGRHGGAHLHRPPRRRLAAPRVLRAQRVDDGDDGARQLAPGRRLRRPRQAGAQPQPYRKPARA